MTSFDQVAFNDPVSAAQMRDAGRFDGHTIGAMPVARRTDPDTSHAAALTVGRGLYDPILKAFDVFVTLIDDELCAYLHEEYAPSVKSARSRLSKAGLLVDTGLRRKSDRGRDSIVWRTA